MNNSHPDELEIQQYVLDKSSCSDSIRNHIESCAICLEEVGNYRVLFSAIEHQSTPAFDFDLPGLVLQQLPPASPKLTADRFIAGFLVLFICCCIGIPLYLFRIYLLNMFSGISPFFIYSILASAFVIVVIKALELYRKYQKQIHLLNYN